MVKIEIEIKDEFVSQWGGIVIGGFIQDNQTGNIIGVKEVSAPAFITTGGKNVIYARVTEDTNGRPKKRVVAGK